MASVPTVIIKVDTVAELTNFVNSKPVMLCLEDGKLYGWNGSTPEILGGGGSAEPQTVVYSTASLANNAEESGTVEIAKTFYLLKMAVDRASRVRVYSTAAYRAADAGRVIGEIPAGEHGVIADGYLLADNLILDLMPVPIGTNAEAVRTADIPIKIQNKSGSAGTVEVTFTYLVIEA
jgi:hypothetical protein